MSARNKLAFLLVYYILLQSFTHCIRLGKEEEALLRQILQEFESNPEDGRYDRTIETRHSDAQLIPKIFIWCPIRHYDLTINCPVHNCPLRVGRWTDVLQGIRTDPRNPRLVYDLHGISYWCKLSTSAATDYPNTRKLATDIYRHVMKFWGSCHPLLIKCSPS